MSTQLPWKATGNGSTETAEAGNASDRTSNLLAFPVPVLEQYDTCDRDRTLGNYGGNEHAVRTQSHRNRQPVSQRDFQQPEAEKVHDGRCHRVSRTVEGLQHYHQVGVPDIAITDDA